MKRKINIVGVVLFTAVWVMYFLAPVFAYHKNHYSFSKKDKSEYNLKYQKQVKSKCFDCDFLYKYSHQLFSYQDTLKFDFYVDCNQITHKDENHSLNYSFYYFYSKGRSPPVFSFI